MITVLKTLWYTSQENLIEAVCLSTDTKPTTGIANGSQLIEMDTGKIYFYDKENTEWKEM